MTNKPGLPKTLALAAAAALLVVTPLVAAAEGGNLAPAVVGGSSTMSEMKSDKRKPSMEGNEEEKLFLELALDRGINLDLMIDEPKPEGIINGVETNGPVPYQVALMYRNIFYCGGSLISPRAVLTAAHCLYAGDIYIPEYNFPDFLPRVQVNLYNRYDNAGVGNIYVNSAEEGVDIIVHDDYDGYLTNDIAVIILPFEVRGPNIQYAQINEDPNIPSAGEALDVTGWGRYNVNQDDASAVLLKTTLDYVTPDQCRRMWQGGDFITDSMICARRDGTSTCSGDSGGPLVLASPNNGTVVQVGIVSWGPRSCSSLLPSGYTRVSSYSSWIKETVCTRTGELCQQSKSGKSSKSTKSTKSTKSNLARESMMI